jgi:hypothetical protein
LTVISGWNKLLLPCARDGRLRQKEVSMTTYAVQRTLTGITMDQLAGAQKAAIACSAAMTAEGSDVRYIRSNFYPASAHCTCLFEAKSAEDVRRLNEKAKLPYDKIEEVLDLNP